MAGSAGVSLGDGPPPGSTASLRVANQRRVLAVVQNRPETGAFTQAEIARLTQLAPATVSKIVRELSAAGIVETTAGAGRRGTTVEMTLAAGLIAGIDFGHRHIRVAFGDLTGQVIAESHRPISPTHPYREGLTAADEMLRQLLADHHLSADDVLTVGMGIPAPIGSDGRVVSSSILPGWVGVRAEEVAGSHLGKPVYVDNDANLGALAEHRRGAGVGHSCMVYIKVSSGVGSGLIINGELFHGGGGSAGEIGHLTVDENGPICRCGSRGCLEAYCSVDVVSQMLAAQHPSATFPELVAAAAAGDPSVSRAIEDVGRHLGWGVAMLANLINPTCVVVGGDMAQAGQLLLDSTRSSLRRHALGHVGGEVSLTLSALGDRSSVVGALLTALDRTVLALPGSP
jgi:predicted NBD/HSP70 family sugar kinase